MKGERAIFETIRWFDLFDRPVTLLELVERLAGQSQSLGYDEVKEAVENSKWLADRVGWRDGFLFVRGREALVAERLRREARAQRKWKLVRGAQTWLAMVPFVRGLAGSGSLAINNTKEESDLDIFVIAAPGRIWLARLGLLLMGELTGRRRRHWHQQAPDTFCLNHYVSEDQLIVSPDIQNMYTAMLYTSMVPLYGEAAVERFWEANTEWMGEYVRWRRRPSLLSNELRRARPAGLHVYTRELPGWAQGVKYLVESVLAEPAWDGLERAARAVQLYFIGRHRKEDQVGRVVTTNQELAFHPDTKVPSLLARFEGRV